MKNTLCLLLIALSFTINAQNEVKLDDSWGGKFNKSNINLVILKTVGDSVFGRTKVGENIKGIKGTYTRVGNVFSANMEEYKILKREPMTYKDNGYYNIVFNVDTKTANGSYEVKRGSSISKILYEIKRDDYYSEEFAVGKWISYVNGERTIVEIKEVTKDSIYGTSRIWSEKHGERIKKLKGTFQRRYETWNSFIAMTLDEYNTNENTSANGTFRINFALEKNTAKALWTIGNHKLELELEKETIERIEQSSEIVTQIDTNISKLEIHINELIEYYEKILHDGKWVSSYTIQKAKDKMLMIDNFTSQNKIPNDASKLTYSQEQRMKDIKTTIILYQASGKLQRLLEGRY